MDPATMAAFGSMFPGLLGGNQVAPAAPAIQPTSGPQVGLMGGPQTLPQPADFLPQQMNPIASAMQDMPNPLAEAPEQEAEKPAGLLGNFMGGIDKAFESPAKLLGIGLLNQHRPGLGTLGLGALGAYNAWQNRGK